MIPSMRFVFLFLFTTFIFYSKAEEQLSVLNSSKTSLDLAIKETQQWILGKRDSEWGWRTETHRAIITLAMAEPRMLLKNNLENQLTIKQLNLQLAMALQENEEFSAGQLALYINALLVVCHDPGNFYGKNLIKRLQNQALSGKYESALVTLTLCNAGVEMNAMNAHIEQLKDILTQSENGRLRDYEAMAVLALQCTLSKTTQHDNVKESVKRSLQKFSRMQNPQNGGFGNIYSTGIFVQALMESGDEVEWNKTAALDYLALEQIPKLVLHAVDGDLLATFFALPPVAGRTFVSVSNFDCNTTSWEEDVTKGPSSTTEMINKDSSELPGIDSALRTTVGVAVISVLGCILVFVLTVHLVVKHKCFRKRRDLLINEDDYVIRVASIS